MRYFLTFTLFLSAFLFSCNNQVDSSNTNGAPANVVPFTEVGNQMKLQQQTATTIKDSEVTNNEAKLNPAHGQPGHRCEIAVGAPLNSAAAPLKTTTAAATKPVKPAAAVETNPAVANPPTVTAEGMNPPHGQTNHRCDIAVGAPLPSL